MPELDLGNVMGPGGKSAYQTAIDAGYSGSEEAFNAALVAVPGHIADTDIHVTAAQKDAWNSTVRYDAAQSLTDVQKTQARGNIGAAQDGYGLGRPTGKYITDANEAVLGGFYYWGRNAKNTPFEYGAMIVIPRSSGSLSKPNVTQIASMDQSGDYALSSILAVRKSTSDGDGAWGEWEYLNPPMSLGVEYRTTERYWGKPVYVKLVDCGNIADNKKVAHGISNMQTCLFFMGVKAGESLTQIYNHSLSDVWTSYVVAVNRTNITLACGSSAAGTNCQVTLKYTKTTD